MQLNVAFLLLCFMLFVRFSYAILWLKNWKEATNMRCIIAPDSFKGSLSAIEAAEAMECGMKRIFPLAEFHKIPIADGGEGTVETLVYATGGTLRKTTVMGPLGDNVDARWGVLGDGKTAVIEMAAASGLTLVEVGKRDVGRATTYGTGQLIRAALDAGLPKLMIGIGGSATNDGGAGMAEALGACFLNKDGAVLPFGGLALQDLVDVDLRGLDSRLRDVEIIVACDVKNPLCGQQGASAVYAPQKGASLQDVARLDNALTRYADVMSALTGKDIRNFPGAGAAGGLGAGLLWFTNARMQSGIDFILESVQFAEKIKNADLIITGEGCTDRQTLCGKAPIGIAALAARNQIPVICISGALGEGYHEIFNQGIMGAQSIAPQPMELDECMENAKELLILAAERTARLIQLGQKLK